MNRLLVATLLVGACASAFAADEMARVISATPVTQQVAVPREACAAYAAPGAPPQCSTQTIYESRTVAYTVIYEYAGRQYSVQMPQNPGANLRLQVGDAPAPMAAGSSVSPSNQVVEDAAMAGPAVNVARPYPSPVQVTYVNPGVSYYGSPFYGSPYYGSPYYGSYLGPVVSLGFIGGYYGGGRYYGGRGGYGHRR
ncbi:MAG: hypothetical protein H7203_02045 [Rhizobacter sp.]|nr:hypothetical protein [Burkholderiales bacterium]